ncbi:MAG: IS110 family transposase [Cytophagales bacterium]|nr:MAG: IS110 family transposase [Cytophagales bacterium]
MSETIAFSKVHKRAAAIDIGASKIYVSPDGEEVLVYETFTADYRRCVADLQTYGIDQVCMEATGVYWIALYDMLDSAGIKVCLVNPKEVKQVKGRKTDTKDCRWIQKVFSAGLVRESYVPTGKLREIRMMVRERQDIISMGSSYVNKLQKYLELMNIKLTGVLSQINGVSSIKMIEAIIAGERDAKKLLMLCSKSIIENKSEQVLKALEGNYNESTLFMLEQTLKMWKLHEAQVLVIDKKIEELLNDLEQGKPTIEAKSKPKAIRHHAPKIEDLHQKLINIYGVDGNILSGINNYTMLRLLGEVGTDMSRFPSEKHFVSWLQLSPNLHQSGKGFRQVKIRAGSKAGQIFREVAFGLLNSKDVAIGAFMRKLKSRKDSKTAIKAGARKLALSFFYLLTKGGEYVEIGVKKYQELLMDREKKYLQNLAKKHNMIVTQP